MLYPSFASVNILSCITPATSSTASKLLFSGKSVPKYLVKSYLSRTKYITTASAFSASAATVQNHRVGGSGYPANHTQLLRRKVYKKETKSCTPKSFSVESTKTSDKSMEKFALAKKYEGLDYNVW